MGGLLLKHKNRFRNILLSVILFVLYTVTYFVSITAGRPMDLLNYIAAAGTVAGICVILFWLPSAYFYTLVLFACVAQYFGMMFDFYTKFPLFDVVLHFFSGLMLAAFGYYLYRLLTQKAKDDHPPLILPVLFSVFFAISCAGIWEIYEFLADTFFGLTAQGTGVRDTMEDIIAGSSSAVLFGMIQCFYLSRKRGRADRLDKHKKEE